jgi:hypothetical protein
MPNSGAKSLKLSQSCWWRIISVTLPRADGYINVDVSETLQFWETSVYIYRFVCLFLAQQPSVGKGILVHEVSSWHTKTHHSRKDSSGRVISSSPRLQPDNRQHLEQTDIHAFGGIRTHNLGRCAATNIRLRPRGHRDWQYLLVRGVKFQMTWIFNYKTVYSTLWCSQPIRCAPSGSAMNCMI